MRVGVSASPARPARSACVNLNFLGTCFTQVIAMAAAR